MAGWRTVIGSWWMQIWGIGVADAPGCVDAYALATGTCTAYSLATGTGTAYALPLGTCDVYAVECDQ